MSAADTISIFLMTSIDSQFVTIALHMIHQPCDIKKAYNKATQYNIAT